MARFGVAVVGAGYWGPNLLRNFLASPDCEVRWLCDLDVARAELVAGRHSGVMVTDALDDVLSDPEVQIVAVATPASTHATIGLACLDAGKHVVIEKPLASTVAEGEKLVDTAERHGLVLLCDHTFCYTPVVERIRHEVESGAVGDIQYVDSVRINLGLVQPDIDVIWDLAPHDLSVLDFVLPADRRPHSVAAHGADPLGRGVASLAYLTLPLDGGAMAHAHVNWLSPVKVRTTIVAGTRRVLVWNDLNPTQKLSIYDSGVDLADPGDPDARREALVNYRSGDVLSPALPAREALAAVVAEMVSSVRGRRAPRTDGQAGLRVLRTLASASQSLSQGGAPVALAPPVAPNATSPSAP